MLSVTYKDAKFSYFITIICQLLDSTLNQLQDVESTLNRRCFNVVCTLGSDFEVALSRRIFTLSLLVFSGRRAHVSYTYGSPHAKTCLQASAQSDRGLHCPLI